jgi:glycosyltransferase involved in cell wall biosynthesis
MLRYLLEGNLCEAYMGGSRINLMLTSDAELVDPQTGICPSACSFDLIVVPLGFEKFDFPDVAKCLREIRKLLNPGGELILLSLAADRIYKDPKSFTLALSQDDPQLAFGYGTSALEPLSWITTPEEKFARFFDLGIIKHCYHQKSLIKLGEFCGLNYESNSTVSLDLPTGSIIPRRTINSLKDTDSAIQLSIFKKPPLPLHTGNPLVSVCIPAHKITYLRASLESALNQTYQNIELIVSDDSGGNEIETLLREYEESGRAGRIKYCKCPVRDAEYNHIYAMQNASGDYIKLLNDDDLLDSRNVETLAALLMQNPEASLVTSARTRIDSSGNQISPQGPFLPITKELVIIDGQYASSLALSRGNFIGEPNCTLFRRSYFVDIGVNFFRLDAQGPVIGTPGDLAAWLNLLSRGDLIYCPTVLSYLRVHEDSLSHRSDENLDYGKHAWRRLREQAKWKGIGRYAKHRTDSRVI